MSARSRLLCLKVVTVAVLSLVACENPMLGTLKSVVRDYSTPKVTVFPATGAGIAQTTAIAITFTETIDTGTLVLGGNLVPESDGGAWASAAGNPNDTLLVSPQTQWTPGSGRTLTVECADTEGNAIVPLSLTYGVLEGVVYVRAGDGSDDNPGTIDLPKATVQAAVDTAEAVYSAARVHVAEGTYTAGESIFVAKDISLYGGYAGDDWSEGARDPAAHLTKLVRVASTISAVLIYQDGVTSATVLDGFTLDGAGGSASSCIFCSGGSPTIQNNIIRLGSADTAYGISLSESSAVIQGNSLSSEIGHLVTLIACDDSSPQIVGNTLESTSADQLIGISNLSSDSAIYANDIRVGLCIEWGIGIFNLSSNPLIRNNVIHGGQSPDSTGIWNQSASPTIQNNIINGGNAFGTSAMVTAIYNFQSSMPVIENNLIHTDYSGSGNTQSLVWTGVWQVSAADLPAKFNNNDLFDCPDGNYYDAADDHTAYVSSGSVAMLETRLTSQGVPASGNLFNVDPEISSVDGDFTVSSPASVTAGGLNLSVYFTTDKKGVPRTVPWSIGAYEKD